MRYIEPNSPVVAMPVFLVLQQLRIVTGVLVKSKEQQVCCNVNLCSVLQSVLWIIICQQRALIKSKFGASSFHSNRHHVSDVMHGKVKSLSPESSK